MYILILIAITFIIIGPLLNKYQNCPTIIKDYTEKPQIPFPQKTDFENSDDTRSLFVDSSGQILIHSFNNTDRPEFRKDINQYFVSQI
jgi:hypothetical protein